MKSLVNAPRGVFDITPDKTGDWRKIESVALKTAERYGFLEIRIPTIEHTELFCRSVGDTTDVVQKEMFTFTDRGGRSLSLRPEGTAGVVRAAISSGLLNGALPSKLCYILSCFRNERPQAGRFKEFHQFGAELFGSASPVADVELISMANDYFNQLGIKGLELEINSIGCASCREKYKEALILYFEKRKEKLCDSCKERLVQNPLRLLDCKNPSCKEEAKDAPEILDYLCDDCADHFKKVLNGLDSVGIEYRVNPRIVRGLDYYNRTVFEFVSGHLGAQSALCGGGRYDSLVENMGGPKTPALGFAVGLERLLMIMTAIKSPLLGKQDVPEVFLLPLGERAKDESVKIADGLRKNGVWAETDLMDRSLKAQMKYADKRGAKYTCVLGDDELDSGVVTLKRMADGESVKVSINELADWNFGIDENN